MVDTKFFRRIWSSSFDCAVVADTNLVQKPREEHSTKDRSKVVENRERNSLDYIFLEANQNVIQAEYPLV